MAEERRLRENMRKAATRFTERLQVDVELLSCLEAKGILRTGELEELKGINKHLRSDRALQLQFMLQNKSLTQWYSFYELLIQTNYEDLADILMPDKIEERRRAASGEAVSEDHRSSVPAEETDPRSPYRAGPGVFDIIVFGKFLETTRARAHLRQSFITDSNYHKLIGCKKDPALEEIEALNAQLRTKNGAKCVFMVFIGEASSSEGESALKVHGEKVHWKRLAAVLNRCLEGVPKVALLCLKTDSERHGGVTRGAVGGKGFGPTSDSDECPEAFRNMFFAVTHVADKRSRLDGNTKPFSSVDDESEELQESLESCVFLDSLEHEIKSNGTRQSFQQMFKTATHRTENTVGSSQTVTVLHNNLSGPLYFFNQH